MNDDKSDAAPAARVPTADEHRAAKLVTEAGLPGLVAAGGGPTPIGHAVFKLVLEAIRGERRRCARFVAKQAAVSAALVQFDRTEYPETQAVVTSALEGAATAVGLEPLSACERCGDAGQVRSALVGPGGEVNLVDCPVCTTGGAEVVQ